MFKKFSRQFTALITPLIILEAGFFAPYTTQVAHADTDILSDVEVTTGSLAGGTMYMNNAGFDHEYESTDAANFGVGNPVFLPVDVENLGNTPMDYTITSEFLSTDPDTDPLHILNQYLKISFCRVRNNATTCADSSPALLENEMLNLDGFTQTVSNLPAGDKDSWHIMLKVFAHAQLSDGLGVKIRFNVSAVQHNGPTAPGGFRQMKHTTKENTLVFYSNRNSMKLNEVFYDPTDSTKSFIELYNPTDDPIDLGGICVGGQNDPWKITMSSNGGTSIVSATVMPVDGDGHNTSYCSETSPPDRTAYTVAARSMALIVPIGGTYYAHYAGAEGLIGEQTPCSVPQTCLPNTKVIEVDAPAGFFSAPYDYQDTKITLYKPATCMVPYTLPCPVVVSEEAVADDVDMSQLDSSQSNSTTVDDVPGFNQGQTLSRVYIGLDTDSISDWSPTKEGNPGRGNVAFNEIGVEGNDLQDSGNNTVEPFLELYNQSFHSICVDGWKFFSSASGTTTLGTGGCNIGSDERHLLNEYVTTPQGNDYYTIKLDIGGSGELPSGFAPSTGSSNIQLSISEPRTFRGVTHDVVYDSFAYKPDLYDEINCPECNVYSHWSFQRETAFGNGVGPYYSLITTADEINTQFTSGDQYCVGCTIPMSFSMMAPQSFNASSQSSDESPGDGSGPAPPTVSEPDASTDPGTPSASSQSPPSSAGQTTSTGSIPGDSTSSAVQSDSQATQSSQSSGGTDPPTVNQPIDSSSSSVTTDPTQSSSNSSATDPNTSSATSSPTDASASAASSTTTPNSPSTPSSNTPQSDTQAPQVQ